MAVRPQVVAFLDAAKSNPEDDTPRLVLADWLEDHDDPRGEFVRVHCRLCATEWGDEHGDDLQKRKNDLLSAHADAWTEPLWHYVLDRHFWRGLLRVNLTAQALLDAAAAGAAMEEAWAWVEVFTIRNAAAVPPDELASFELLRGAGAIHLRDGRIGLRGAQALAQGAPFRNLHTIDLRFNGLDSAALLAIAKSSAFPALRHLELAYNGINDVGLVALADSPLLAQLRSLGLYGNTVGERAIQALAESPYLPPDLKLSFDTPEAPASYLAMLRRRLGLPSEPR